MPVADIELLERVMDTDRYPLLKPRSAAWVRAVAAVRQDLERDGCSVLTDFVRESERDELRRQGQAIADHAYDDVETVNVYNTAPDGDLPVGHPGRITMHRENAFVARDHIPADQLTHRLYTCELFQRFLADCLGLTRIHPLADPLAGLCLNVVEPGRQHPWHFDTNELAVSLLIQEPEDGGAFEYCPNIRSAENENFDDVAAVLAGRGEHLVRRKELRPGDLQIFHGRYSLHRVATVGGRVARHTAIFSYSERPGVVGSVVRTRQLFGRLTPAHQNGHQTVRVDQLLD